MKPTRGSLGPILALLFAAPVVGELISGSAPPSEFFNPFALLPLAALYGSGAILVRELRVRWGKPWWPTVLILGAAYGIVEEGLACKSFFDPYWEDLDALGVYGRWAGVNWVWSLDLTIFHAVFSIAVSILLVELLFPSRRDEPWLGCAGMALFPLLLLADVVFIFLLITPYRPPLPHVLVTMALVAALYLLARRLPARKRAPRPGGVPRPLWFALVGFLANTGFFTTMWALPELGWPVGVTITCTLGLSAVTVWAVRRLSHGGAWTDEHRFALAAGALMFFVLLWPVAGEPREMTFVSLAALAFLIWMWRRVRARAGSAQGQTAEATQPISTPSSR